MKKWIVMFALAGAVSIGAVTEWRYSADMQEHIETVNADLASAQIEAAYNTGLLGSLQSMTDETTVATEIIDTHNHVHTIKDEVLARGIKQAAANGVTVGGSIQSVIAYWQTKDF